MVKGPSGGGQRRHCPGLHTHPPLPSCPAPGRSHWFCTAGGQGSPPPLHQVECTAGGQGSVRWRGEAALSWTAPDPPLPSCSAPGRTHILCTAGGQGYPHPRGVRWRVEAALSLAAPAPPLPSCPAPGRRRWFCTAGGQGYSPSPPSGRMYNRRSRVRQGEGRGGTVQGYMSPSTALMSSTRP